MHVRLEPVVRLADRRRGERVRGGDVRAGGEVLAVQAEHDLGPRQVQQVGIAGEVARMVAEALAPVRVLAADLALDHHAPRPVEDGDPFGEKPFQSVACAAQETVRLPPKEVREPVLAGSLGVW